MKSQCHLCPSINRSKEVTSLGHHPLVSLPGGMAKPEDSWRVPSWFEGNNRTQGQSVHRRPSARQGVTWILNPEGVQASWILPVITLPGAQLFPRSPDFYRVSTSPQGKVDPAIPGHLTCPLRFKRYPEKGLPPEMTSSTPLAERQDPQLKSEAKLGLLSFHPCSLLEITPNCLEQAPEPPAPVTLSSLLRYS